LFLSFLEYLYLIAFIFKKKKYKLFFLLILSPFILIFYIKYSITHYKCKGWEKGLLNTQLESKEDSIKANKCYILSPKFCLINAYENILIDYSKHFKKSCKNKDNNKKNIEQFLTFEKNTKYKYISYPSTVSLNYREDGDEKFFHNNILSKISPVNSTDDDPIREIFIEFDKKNRGKVIIDLKKNNTLIKEREKLIKNFSVKYDNIFFLYTDAISRPHFRKKMKKTIKLLEDYYYNNPNKKLNWNSYQFFKYNSFTAATLHNVFPMFFGRFYKANGTSIIKYFKEHGYITAYAQNQCQRYLFSLNKNYNNFTFEIFDHEFISLFCDPNYSHPKYYSYTFNGVYSIFRRCLYGNDTFNHIFEYGKQFVEKYRNQRKFLKLAFIEGHEKSKEVIKLMDDALCNFIKYLMKEFPTNTAIIIVSDHGNNMGGSFGIRNSEQYIVESALPNLYLILEEKSDYNHTAIEINEQRLITAYDIYETMLDMTGLYEIKYKSGYGQTLFKEITKKRKCSDYEEFKLSLYFCRCYL
jgi:hypothetical protein